MPSFGNLYPRYWGDSVTQGQWQVPRPWGWKTVTTNTTAPVAPVVSDEQIRKIVRQELADLLPIDVPDTLPEEE